MNVKNYTLRIITLCGLVVVVHSLRWNKNNVKKTFENRVNIMDLSSVTEEEIIAANNLSTSEECARTCESNNPKKCYYRFCVEQYTVMGRACEICTPNAGNACQCILADGIRRSAFTANRMIPGPMIEVCKGDTVIIDVVNQTPSASVTIHWHGVMQNGSPFYDGVPYVTQCPIQPANSFRYMWKANDPGSHFWHSHIGLQKTDGLTGPIVIRQPKSDDPHGILYDQDLTEHVVFLQDWSHMYFDHFFPGFRRYETAPHPNSILVNGKGNFHDPKTGLFSNAPVEVFHVTADNKYRFRLINAFASTCTVQVTVEEHEMIVISADGHPIVPVKVGSIISVSAERFDFILQGNKSEGAFWMYIKALEPCEWLKLDQVAILKYSTGAQHPETPRPTYYNHPPFGKVLNPLDANCDGQNEDVICISELQHYGDVNQELLGENVEQIYLPFGFVFNEPEELFKPDTYWPHMVDSRGKLATGIIDNIVYTAAPSPLLSQYHDINPGRLCNRDDAIPNCGLMCKCTHVIEVEHNSIVELIIADEVHVEDIHHPFHLHGHAFLVMGTGKMPEAGKGTLEEAVKQSHEKRRFNNTVVKDTVMIPSKGYVVLRFKAENIGFWLLHCHFMLHIVTGMMVVMQVGAVDQMPQPPSNFPKCGSFYPPIV